MPELKSKPDPKSCPICKSACVTRFPGMSQPVTDCTNPDCIYTVPWHIHDVLPREPDYGAGRRTSAGEPPKGDYLVLIFFAADAEDWELGAYKDGHWYIQGGTEYHQESIAAWAEINPQP